MDYQLRIGTWNIRSGVPSNVPPERAVVADDAIEYMAEFIKRTNSQIVSLQEVLFLSDDTESQAKKIANLAGFPYWVEWKISDSHLIKNAEIGNAIISKYPIIEQKRIHLVNPELSTKLNGKKISSHNKGFLQITFDIKNKKFTLISGQSLPFHLFKKDPTDYKYIFEELEQIILNVYTPSIVCGDFNTNQIKELFPSINFSQLTGVITRPTGEEHDNFLCSKHWTNVNVWVLPTRSDHHFCLAELEIQSINEPKLHRVDRSSEPTSILHLSDLHFGKGVTEDIDIKTKIELVKPHQRIEQFIQYMQHALPRKPDFLVVSGDFTNKGHESGFIEFIKIANDLIINNKFPDANRFIVVPGNHDIDHRNIQSDNYSINRWLPFKNTIGAHYARPWIPAIDFSMDTMLRIAKETISQDFNLKGGSHDYKQIGEKVALPFILDTDKNILFYAFNSSSISGTNIELPKETKFKINSLKTIISNLKNNELTDAIDSLEKELLIDPSRVDPDELTLFTNIMEILKNHFGNDYLNKIFKVAVLHHHITPIVYGEEFKKFESLLNAGILKYHLQQSGFHLILHGHKHWPETYLDTAVTNGGSHIVVSGSTIGGNESKGKEPGFFWIEHNHNDESVDIRFIELKTGMHTIRDFNEKSVERFEIPISRKKVGFMKDDENKYQLLNLRSLYKKTNDNILKYLSTREHNGKKLTGWGHRLENKRIGTIGTAYGLLIMNLIRLNDKNYDSVYPDLIKTLWDLRIKDKGWYSSSSQMTKRGKPEVTLWILNALNTCDEKQKVNTAISDFEKLINLDDEITFFEHTYSVSLAIRVLSKINPNLQIIDLLLKILVSSSVRDSNGYIKFWCENTITNIDKREDFSIKPSVIHTAHAIIALCYAFRENKHEMPSVQTAVNWLLSHEKWDNHEEIIQRQTDDAVMYDQLIVNHYTEPWVVVALLESGVDVHNRRITNAMLRIYENSVNGLWNWGKVKYPIWATYDALNALTEYSLRGGLIPIS